MAFLNSGQACAAGTRLLVPKSRLDKVAQAVLRLADSDRLPAHLLIGSDAVRFAAEAEATRAAEATQWRELSLSTDVDATTALPRVRF